MNRRIVLALVLLVAGALSRTACSAPDAASRGWEPVEKVMRYTPENLFDHIDGAAELFLEFGFQQLAVQRWQRGDAIMSLELYRMARPEGALGVYLTMCGEETPLEGVDGRSSGDRYQLLVQKGASLVIVDSYTGRKELMPAMAALASKALAEIPPGAPVAVLSRLPREGLVAGSVRIIGGPLALKALFSLGEGDILSLGRSLFAVAGSYRGAAQQGNFTRIIVPYPDREAALAAYDHLTSHLDSQIDVVTRGSARCTFRDYRGKLGAITIEGSVIDIVVNCDSLP